MSRTSRRSLYLVRHGATDANLRRPYVLQGQQIDLPLSPLGRRQAEAARGVLAERPIELFVSSPLQRAMETAAILAEPHGKSVEAARELIECDVGRWEGRSWETIRLEDRAAWEAFDADPASVPYLGGESFAQVERRVVSRTEQLLGEHPEGDLVIVTHNVVARVYIAHLMGLPIAKARAIRQDNGGITVIDASDGAPKVVSVNSVFHLEGLLNDRT